MSEHHKEHRQDTSQCPGCQSREETIQRLSERCRLQRMFIESIFDLLEDRGILNANPTLTDLFAIFKDEETLDRALSTQSHPRPHPEESTKILDLTAERKKRQNL